MSKASLKSSKSLPENSGKLQVSFDAKKQPLEKRFTAQDIKQFSEYFEVLKKIHVRIDTVKATTSKYKKM